MKNSIKLAAAIAAVNSSAAMAACPAGTADVSGTYGAIAGFTDYCELEGVYLSPLTLTNDTLWVLEGKVEIGNAITSAETAPGSKRFVISEIDTSDADATTLTVDAGATIIGDNTEGASVDFLVVNRGSDVFMNGTAADPIRMTGRQNLQAASTADQQWGGLYINGYGITNECDQDFESFTAGVNSTSTGITGTAGAGAGDCERAGEAGTGRYGGNNNADDSGSLSYVTVAYAGNAFDPETDLNGVAFQAVGNGTSVSHIQVHQNKDDGVEFYGGAVNVSNLVLTDSGDDSFDTTGGWVGAAQYVLISQNGAGNDRAFESDNNKSPNGAFPRTNGTISNVTIVSSNGDTSDVLKIRRGSELNLANMVISDDAGTCFNIDDGDGDGNVSEATLSSVSVDCAVMTDKALADTWLANNAGEVVTDLVMMNGYIDLASNAIAPTDLSAVNGIEATSFIGAVESCENDWTTGWVLAGTLPTVDTNACDKVNTVNVPVMGWAGLVALAAGLAGVTRLVRRVA